MAVKLRLRRLGKKKQPVYKVVAADARSPRDGKFIEAIGSYNPMTNPATIDIQEDRALYWLGVGAQPTDTVKNIFSRKGILLKRELTKRGLSQEEIAAKMEEWNKLAEAKLATEKKNDKSKKKETKTESAEKDIKSGSAAEVKGTASEITEAPKEN